METIYTEITPMSKFTPYYNYPRFPGFPNTTLNKTLGIKKIK